MSAVVSRGAAALPLLTSTDPERIFAWRDGRAVRVRDFLADVEATAGRLPPAPYAVNLCEDRYAFLVAFAAVAARGQTTLLPPSRAPQAVAEVLATHAGAYALGDCERSGLGQLVRVATGCAAHGEPRVPAADREHTIAIGFTSGSTGQPKPNPKRWATVVASTRHNIAVLADAIGLAEGAIAHVAATVPPQHMYGLEMSVLLPLQGPFAVHCGRPLFPADVAAALESLPEPRLLVTTPIHLKALLRDPTPPAKIGAIASATAPLPRELAAEAEARYGAPVVELFGSTETCVIAHRRTARESAWNLYPGVALRPQPDRTLVDAPYFVEATPLQDLVELLPERRFLLRGRNADMVEIAGKRASLADLTRRIAGLHGVVDAIAFQLDEDDGGGVRRIAALVVAPGRSEPELIAELRLAVDPVFLPRPLRLVDALPRNETGKLCRGSVLDVLAAADGGGMDETRT